MPPPARAPLLGLLLALTALRCPGNASPGPRLRPLRAKLAPARGGHLLLKSLAARLSRTQTDPGRPWEPRGPQHGPLRPARARATAPPAPLRIRSGRAGAADRRRGASRGGWGRASRNRAPSPPRLGAPSPRPWLSRGFAVAGRRWEPPLSRFPDARGRGAVSSQDTCGAPAFRSSVSAQPGTSPALPRGPRRSLAFSSPPPALPPTSGLPPAGALPAARLPGTWLPQLADPKAARRPWALRAS